MVGFQIYLEGRVNRKNGYRCQREDIKENTFLSDRKDELLSVELGEVTQDQESSFGRKEVAMFSWR